MAPGFKAAGATHVTRLPHRRFKGHFMADFARSGPTPPPLAIMSVNAKWSMVRATRMVAGMKPDSARRCGPEIHAHALQNGTGSNVLTAVTRYERRLPTTRLAFVRDLAHRAENAKSVDHGTARHGPSWYTG